MTEFSYPYRFVEQGAWTSLELPHFSTIQLKMPTHLFKEMAEDKKMTLIKKALDNAMFAYIFTTEEPPDINLHKDFVADGYVVTSIGPEPRAENSTASQHSSAQGVKSSLVLV